MPRLTTPTESYYDSQSANAFYQSFWGGEDIHIGIYEEGEESIARASHRTIEVMAERLGAVDHKTRILDLGSGYGGAARYLAQRFGAQVVCLNLSEVQNAVNHELTNRAVLSEKVEIIHGNFEDIPKKDDAFDIVWSQDAILHSNDKEQVLNEIKRTLAPGGKFIFTDPMQTTDCPDEVLSSILHRIHLDSLASFEFYREALVALTFRETGILEKTVQMGTHYERVRSELRKCYRAAVALSGKEYVDNMIKGLGHWVDGVDNGYLSWGILDYQLAA